MKIIDSVIFYDEIFMLLLRLSIMSSKVDKIVVVEADRSYSGTPKPYNLEKYWPLLFPWHDKLIYHKVVAPWPVTDAWVIENWQRNQLKLAWEELSLDDNDLIVLSDLDEIVRPSTIDSLYNLNYSCYGLYQPTFYFKFNYMAIDSHYSCSPKAIRYGYSKQLQPTQWRHYRSNPSTDTNYTELHHAGWHWSYLMNHAMIVNKIQQYAHQEFNTSEILNNIDVDALLANGGDLFNRQYKWGIVCVDDYFPSIISNFPQLIAKDHQNYASVTKHFNRL